MKDKIMNEIQDIKEKLWEISDYIYHNPEVGDKEFKAVEKLTSFLKENYFNVEIGVANRDTSFRAEFDSKIDGPTVAFMCEYDALPGIGHGCCHNMIGTMSAGAAVSLSKILNEIGGKIVVFGTCAEETNGAKVDMAKQGLFKDIDVAMMVHPNNITCESGSSLAMEALQFEFFGKSSHAAAAPEEGINALDAVILTFNGINALRQHVTEDVRIHGIIKEGGVAANIVPAKATAQFYVRAKKKKNLKQLVEKVKNIAKGASLMTGARVEISNYETSFDDMNTNKTLSKAFNKNLELLGITDIHAGEDLSGSMDMGNVSYEVPSIHPMIGLGNTNLVLHTTEAANFTITDPAHEALLIGAASLAYTGYDVITNKDLLSEIKQEFISMTK
ncbi:M20 family metallopeptidase [uncultured Clostridium sp.]|uniref:M20 family metallopeptidase n=1 Tax=uncultured Clostridium sp. TaxID=59620 RepID=UPI002585A557|nr:M20 family metallopeptidase [uncultured Clostridium sp.]